MSILDSFHISGNSELTLVLLCLATFRVYLECVQFDFEGLPLTRGLAQQLGSDAAGRFHRYGLYMSLGYILLFAPGYLLS